MAESTSSWFFRFLATLVAIIIFAVAIANIVYFSRLRSGGTLTTTEKNSMFYFNIALAILAFIIMIYGLYTLLFGSESRKEHYKGVKESLRSDRGILDKYREPSTVRKTVITEHAKPTVKPPSTQSKYVSLRQAQPPVPKTGNITRTTTSTVRQTGTALGRTITLPTKSTVITQQ